MINNRIINKHGVLIRYKIETIEKINQTLYKLCNKLKTINNLQRLNNKVDDSDCVF